MNTPAGPAVLTAQRIIVCHGQVCTPYARGEPLPNDGFVWLDLTYDQIDLLAPEVAELTGVHIFEDHILDAKNLAHPSFYDNTDDYEMIIFRGLAPGNGARERIETRPMIIFSFDRLIATVRAPDSRSVEQVRTRFLGQPGRVPRSVDEMIHRLLSAQVDHYLDLRQSLTNRVERWQSQLLDPRHPFRDWRALLAARNEIHRLENLCEEQHDAVQEWRDARFQDISPELQVRITDLVEHIQRVLSHARRVESTIESAVQLHFAAVTHRTSEIMRVLTLITAIFMPLTLVTGIFGMNFEMIPGLHSRWGFWLSLGGMIGIVLGLLFLFRRKRWM